LVTVYVLLNFLWPKHLWEQLKERNYLFSVQ
jgi:hypothetical protein